MGTLLQDVRYGIRMLVKSPGFTAIAVLTLALGIGANTAIFSVIDAVLLRPLPYPNPGRLVRVWEVDAQGNRQNISDANFADLQGQNHTFQTMSQYSADTASVSGGSEPVRLSTAVVSKEFFQTMGVQAYLGRDFVEEELHQGGARAVIVSYGYWQRYLGGTREFKAARLRIDGQDYAVVGVMPRGFTFPSGSSLWIPRELFEHLPSRTALNWHGLARLRDGVSIGQARADLSAIARRLKQQYGKETWMSDATAAPLLEAMVGPVRPALLAILGASGFLLLVACANVASLLLAQASKRRKELAVRVVLGAGRARLVQQFLTETLLLALVGGTVGIILALWGVGALTALAPSSLPRLESIEVDWTVFGFALSVSILVAVVLGLITAMRATETDSTKALSEGGRLGTSTASSRNARGALVAVQVAMTLVLLVGAGLLARSFYRLLSVDPGFHSKDLVSAEITPVPPQNNSENTKEVQFLDSAIARLRTIPGAWEVGLTGALPLSGDSFNGEFLILAGIPGPKNFGEFERIAQNPDRTGFANYCAASEGYFRALGIPLLRGRLFDDRDGIDAPHVALISDALARSRWPAQDPIGQQLEFGNMDGDLRPLTVIGIVGDVRMLGLDRPPTPIIYVNYRQRPQGGSTYTLLIRSTAPPAKVISGARGALREIDPALPVKFSTVVQTESAWLADRRFTLLLLCVFGATALLIATVGIYGVVAYTVRQRTQEIGIRVALGARRDDILRLILGYGLRFVIAGMMAGVAGALAVSRFLENLLFGITPADPVTLSAVALLLGGVALAACYVPARRAMKVDPMVALRYE